MKTPNTGRRRPTLEECAAAANARIARFGRNLMAEIHIIRATGNRQLAQQKARWTRFYEAERRGRISARLGA